jgi:hypothetical protein
MKPFTSTGTEVHFAKITLCYPEPVYVVEVTLHNLVCFDDINNICLLKETIPWAHREPGVGSRDL